jgi:glycosyltransferase involved in cell wall biosynthesis
LEGRFVVVYGGPEAQPPPGRDNLGFRTLRVGNHPFAGGRLYFQPFWKAFRRFGKPSAVITPQSLRYLSFAPLFAYCRARRIPVVLRGHGGSRRRRVSSSLAPADLTYRWFIRHCDAFICYTDQGRDELALIDEPGKLFVARNTIDTEALFAIRRELEAEGREAVCVRLGIPEADIHLSYIGRLIPAKRVDLLLDAAASLERRGKRTALAIVGGGPERQRLEAQASRLGLSNVRFLGELNDPLDSSGYLFTSDAMVMPGYVGLAVNQVLSLGVPVVTTRQGPNGPYHSPEVAYLTVDTTAIFAEPYDVESIARSILSVKERQQQMSTAAKTYAEANLTLDAMVQGHVDAVVHARGW